MRDLLNAAKGRITEIETDEAERRLATNPAAVVLDVREADEHDQGALPGAVHIPRGCLESQVESKVPDREAELVVYCAGGTRSAFAADTLQQLGYTNVVSMAGGFRDWASEIGEVE